MDNEFERELTALLNKHSEDNLARTPDFILASYLLNCLMAFKLANDAREQWHGRGSEDSPGQLLTR